VNRLMYGERDEPYRVLAHLGEQMEGARDPSSALSVTVDSLARALKLPYVAITLRQDNGRFQTVASMVIHKTKRRAFRWYTLVRPSASWSPAHARQMSRSQQLTRASYGTLPGNRDCGTLRAVGSHARR